jgi:cysteine dioxygenase
MKDYNLEDLIAYAKSYEAEEKSLPIFFDPDHYSRTPIYRDENLEIVVICFAAGQTSTIHDHRGSNCVVRVVKGKMLEQLFRDKGDQLEFVENRYLEAGEVSGLDGVAIHQIGNVSKEGTVLLNFYSPPFRM